MLQTENPFNFFDWNVSLSGGAAGGGGNAGDDDDFGDFKFVPAASSLNDHRHADHAPPPPAPSSSSSNLDDEWGDFVDCFPSDSFHAAPLPSDPFPGSSFIDPSGHQTDQSSRNPKPSSPVGGVSSRPIPLSIFGEDEPEQSEVASLTVLEGSAVGSGFSQSYVSKENPVLAFNDLIANLYSQAEQMNQVAPDANLAGRVSDVEGDSDDKDWEFKGAFSDNHEAGSGLGGIQIEAGSASTRDDDEESNSRDFLVLYSRLKEVGRKYVLQYLDALEKGRKAADLSHDQAKSMALNQEIQAGYAMLHEEERSLSNGSVEDHPLRNAGDVELLRAINDPKFRQLELEYCLSEKILSAKGSLSSALALFKHATSVLCIMMLATVHDQFCYVSAWSKIISTCSKELHHGAFIWRRAQENQVDKAILDDTRGMRYFLSLGEVYRISEVLKVTCELHKPWLLLNRRISRDITSLLKECSSEWNDSGLKEAVARISCPSFEEKRRVLLESIESFHCVDLVSAQNSAFRQPDHLCGLSLLPLNCLHGMESVLWNGQQFFLKLANLWANLISPECPQLPQIHLGK